MKVNTRKPKRNCARTIPILIAFVLSSIYSSIIFGQSQNCGCESEVEMQFVYDDCVSISDNFEVGVFIKKIGASDNNSVLEVLDDSYNVLSSSNVVFSNSGTYTEVNAIDITNTEQIYFRYFCSDLCYFEEFSIINTLPRYDLITDPGDCNDDKGAIEISPKDNTTLSAIWSDGFFGLKRDNLDAGTYEVEIVSSGGCRANESVVLKEYTKIDADVNLMKVDCNGKNSNTISISVQGGSPEYSYTWFLNNIQLGETSNMLSNANSGAYEIIITDGYGCTKSERFNVDFDVHDSEVISPKTVELQPIEFMGNGVSKYMLSQSLNIAYGDLDNDGKDGASLDVSFYEDESNAVLKTNKLPMEYITSPNQLVYARVEANEDCFEIEQVSLSDMDYCLLQSEACDNDPLILLQPVECSAAATPLASGGTYIVYKRDGSDLVLQSGLLVMQSGEWYIDPTDREGSFEIHYTYDDGGMEVTKVALFDIQSLNPQIIIDDEVICGNQPILEIRTNPVGGILSGPNIVDSLTIGTNRFYFVEPAGLTPGLTYEYNYYYQQTNGSGLICSKTAIDAVMIDEYPEIEITTTIDGYCSGSDVELSITNIKNTPNLSYEWFDPNGDVFSTNADATIVDISLDGDYIVNAEAENGCMDADTISIQVIPLPVLDCDISGTVTCPNGADGEATVEIIGAADITNYSFEWDNGFMGQTQTGLQAGVYKVIVTTDMGCVDSCEVEMTQPTLFNILCTNDIEPPLCYGTASGTNTIEVSEGGTPPYQYSKDGNTFSNSPVITDLSVGDHRIYVMDAIGCVDSCFFTVTEPAELQCNAVLQSPANCNGDVNGRAQVTATGGVGNYRYLWDNGETSRTAVSLNAGNHMVTVYDENDCESICSVLVTEPSSLTCSIGQSHDVTCNGGSDGRALVLAQGGNGNYSYLWDNGETNAQAVNLTVGNHSVTVTDVNLCETVCNTIIGQPAALEANPEGKMVCTGMMEPIQSNASANVLYHSWDFAADPGTAENVQLENTDQPAVIVNTMNSKEGMLHLVYEGSDDTQCLVQRMVSVEILQAPSAGEDVTIDICNLDASEYIQSIPDLLSDNATLGGTFTYISGPVIDLSDLDNVNFECAETGQYIFEYEVMDNANCMGSTSTITINVTHCFDLALRKTVSSAPPYCLGCEVTYRIEVINQGEVDAEEVTVTEYITSGFIFEESANTIFQTGNLANWMTSGANAIINTGIIPAGDTREIFINLTIDENYPDAEITNSAEITNYAYLRSDNVLKFLPTDEDDLVIDPSENNDDILDESNGEEDNPSDDDQFDFETINLCVDDTGEIACNNLVNLSLDGRCEIMITADMILEGSSSSYYTIEILDSLGNVVENPVGRDYLDQNLQVTVTDFCGGNSCWSTVKIEDKLPPFIECADDVIVSCVEINTTLPLPIATDDCTDYIDIVITEDDLENLTCSDNYIAVRTITAYAVDSKGNKSRECTSRIFFENIEMDDVTIPDDTHLECSNQNIWDSNNNLYPDVNETGIPSYNNIPLGDLTEEGTLIGNNYCSINVSYLDKRIESCGNTFKVIRYWSVLDWCSNELGQFTQTIFVEDNNNPVVTCAANQVYSIDADSHVCTANWVVPAPVTVFDCHNTTYIVEYLLADEDGNAPSDEFYTHDNVVEYGDGYLITDLPIGKTWIKYTIVDECGNVSYCFTEVEVVDNVPPIPVCDEFTAVSINSDGLAKVFATTFDDGSHDNCSDVNLAVRRMSSGNCSYTSTREVVDTYNGNTYYDSEIFCCNDVGVGDLQVELLVIDGSGHKSTCMVNAQISLKFEPTISCPSGVTIDCDGDYSVDLLGTASYDAVCDIYSLSHRDVFQDYSCSEKDISRIWELTNNNTGIVEKSCTQVISLQNLTPFDLNSVVFPQEVTLHNECLEGLDTSPDNPATNGYPTWPADPCAQIAYSYEDHEFTVVDDACYKILRDWTVIDWCVYNPFVGTEGIIKYTQVIKVIDTELPTIVCNTHIAEVGDDCMTFESISASGNDSCTPTDELRWGYYLDNDEDGIYESFIEDGVYRNNFTIGTYTVKWLVSDRCDNTATCVQNIVIEDNKAPTPYCHAELITVLMENDGTVELWAKDYDLGSSDNCTSELLYTFGGQPINRNSEHYFKVNADGISQFASAAEYALGEAQKWDPILRSSSRSFTCENLGDNELVMNVVDESANDAHCYVTVKIQDNAGICSEEITISGRLTSLLGDPFSMANVYLEANLPEHPRLEVSTNGDYAFTEVIKNEDYTVRPEYNEDHLNGVSTLDIVLIQRHILSLARFENPYHYLAADINNNEKISASDLSQLRKLILGFYEELPDNESWKFIAIDENTNPSEEEVFYMNDRRWFENLNQNMEEIDFMAVKVGDVNNSIELSSSKENDLDSRNLNMAYIDISNIHIKIGEVLRIPVYAKNFEELYGMQWSIQYDIDNVEFLNIHSGILDIGSENFYHKGNAINFSWNDKNVRQFNNSSPLFYLELEAINSTMLYDALSINREGLQPELITEELDIFPLDLSLRDTEEINIEKLMVSQNRPNPFTEETIIEYSIPEASLINISITDMLGKEIENLSFNQEKGSHRYVFNNRLHNVRGGVLFLTISDGTQQSTIKMLTLK